MIYTPILVPDILVGFQVEYTHRIQNVYSHLTGAAGLPITGPCATGITGGALITLLKSLQPIMGLVKPAARML